MIFPQGTRVKFGERLPFKKGAGRIYEVLNLPCVPVALNTERFGQKTVSWNIITILRYLLEPIEPGKDKNVL